MDITPTNPSLADQLAAAQEWWADAGVDCVFEDEPQAWLADPESDQSAAPQAAPETEAAPPPPAPKIGGDPSSWPADLPGFTAWWTENCRIEGSGSRPCIAPRGPAGADVMVLVPMPEEQDSETLLSGPQGQLLANFLKAANIAPERAYIASLMPRHMAMPDWPGLGEQGLGALALHHIALAAPKRLLVLGSKIPPLLGHDPTAGLSPIAPVDANGTQVPALMHHGLEQMMQHGKLKARLWHNWLEWTA